MKKILTVAAFIVAAFISTQAQEPALQQDLSLNYIARVPAGGAKNMPVIILLHGRGGEESSMFAYRGSFPENYLIVAARAPYAMSGRGYQWFDGTYANNQFTPNQQQTDSSRALIGKFIAQVVQKYGADANQVYLIGFSQGARMCYEVGLTMADKLKGIGVLSGFMFESLKPLIKNTPALKHLKIFIAHGTADERIKFADARASADYLKSLGLNPEFHSYEGMPHEINSEEINDLVNWLKK